MADHEEGYGGFIRSLYDFSFTRFVTTRIIKVLYILVTVIYSIGALIALVVLVSRGGAYVAVGIIGVPIMYLLYLAFARVSLEVLAVIFRIAEHTRDIAESTREMRQPGRGQVSPSAE